MEGDQHGETGQPAFHAPTAVTDPAAGLFTHIGALVKTTAVQHVTRQALAVATATLIVMTSGLLVVSAVHHLIWEPIRRIMPIITIYGVGFELLWYVTTLTMLAAMLSLVTAGNAFMTMYTATASWHTALQWVRTHKRHLVVWAFLALGALSLTEILRIGGELIAQQSGEITWWLFAGVAYVWGVATYYGVPALLTDGTTVKRSLRRNARYLRRTAPIIVVLHAIVGGGSLLVLGVLALGLRVGVGGAAVLPRPLYWVVSLLTIGGSLGVVAVLYTVSRALRVTTYQHAAAITQQAATTDETTTF